MLKKILITVFLLAASWFALVYFGQSKMIYFPRRYASSSRYFKVVDQVKFRSGEAAQVAFVYPANRKGAPEVVWWMFGGNGSAALDWLPMLERQAFPEGHVFVMFDYPGYGRCGGKPSPETIYASLDKLHQLLADRWEMTPRKLSECSKTMGHSLGAAVAFKMAADFEMSEVIAISPFTTMKEMAGRRVGRLKCLLKHPFDNRESVARLVEQDPPAKILIFHGSRDFLIPNAMGRELAKLGGAQFQAVKGRGHNDILYTIRPQLIEELKRK